MIFRFSFILLLFAYGTSSAQKQPLAITFQQAEKQGITIAKLDSTYKSAVDANPEKAVFKSPAAQKDLQVAYGSLLAELQKHLATNGFKWEKPTRCFNRIYFTPEGKIDYFLYNFIPKPSDPNPVSEEKRIKFEKLLSSFIKNYQFKLSADVKFAQCSPVTYSD
ncbi:MAG: hypothetical protein EOO45_22070 [Flavobacterium sp.]|nr:MAG: hypothetical protein EOO45_22070 [Flavobacterium sp.]